MNEFYNNYIVASNAVPNRITNWINNSISYNNYPYKFGVFSDLHITRSGSNVGQHNTTMNGYDDFIQALSCSINNGIEFLCTCGDIGTNGLKSETSSSSNRVVELNLWKDLMTEKSNIAYPQFRIKSCAGNHDSTLTTEQWKEKTGCDWSHYFIYKNELYIFISIKHQNSAQGMLEVAYEQDDIDFLESVLNSYPGKRAFIFMHFPLNSGKTTEQYAGLLKSGSGSTSLGNYNNGIYQYGFTLNSSGYNAQNEQIKQIFANYSGHVFFFSGHSHFSATIDSHTSTIKHSKLGSNVDMFHVTSLNQPRNTSAQVINSNDYTNRPVEGYNVTVYQNKIVVDCYEFNLCQDKYHGDIIRSYEVYNTTDDYLVFKDDNGNEMFKVYFNNEKMIDIVTVCNNGVDTTYTAQEIYNEEHGWIDDWACTCRSYNINDWEKSITISNNLLTKNPDYGWEYMVRISLNSGEYKYIQIDIPNYPTYTIQQQDFGSIEIVQI